MISKIDLSECKDRADAALAYFSVKNFDIDGWKLMLSPSQYSTYVNTVYASIKDKAYGYDCPGNIEKDLEESPEKLLQLPTIAYLRNEKYGSEVRLLVAPCGYSEKVGSMYSKSNSSVVIRPGVIVVTYLSSGKELSKKTKIPETLLLSHYGMAVEDTGDDGYLLLIRLLTILHANAINADIMISSKVNNHEQ